MTSAGHEYRLVSAAECRRRVPTAYKSTDESTTADVATKLQQTCRDCGERTADGPATNLGEGKRRASAATPESGNFARCKEPAVKGTNELVHSSFLATRQYSVFILLNETLRMHLPQVCGQGGLRKKTDHTLNSVDLGPFLRGHAFTMWATLQQRRTNT